jgi:cystathionine beta-lyase
MAFDFDTSAGGPRQHCGKWETATSEGARPEDMIPMWVADMDFRAAPCVIEALQREVDRGYMGYFGDLPPVQSAVAGWMNSRHGWSFDPSHIRFTHGVIAAYGNVIDAFSEPGDGVILFAPVYHSFYGKVASMGRTVVESNLVLRDGRYEMDLDTLAGKLTGRERIVTLCSPHNPGGRRWSTEEIRELADFCAAHDLILLSDEIHMDLMFPGVTHVPTAVAAPESLPRLITITAASKGFNLAGGETGFAIIEDDALRARFDLSNKDRGGTPNRFGMIMTKAALSDGGDWSDAARAYIASNYALWRDRIGAIPGLSVMEMDSTYLAWVDFRGTGMSVEEVDRRVFDEARIVKSPGQQFGTGGEGWNRFNLALPRAKLEEAIRRMEAAFGDLQ